VLSAFSSFDSPPLASSKTDGVFGDEGVDCRADKRQETKGKTRWEKLNLLHVWQERQPPREILPISPVRGSRESTSGE
jgi:hypothetical protein